MCYKSYFRSPVGHHVIDNKLTIVSLCRIAIGFVLLREVSVPLCYIRNREGKIIFGSGVGGEAGLLSGVVQVKLLFSTRCFDNRNRIATNCFSALRARKKIFFQTLPRVAK